MSSFRNKLRRDGSRKLITAANRIRRRRAAQNKREPTAATNLQRKEADTEIKIPISFGLFRGLTAEMHFDGKHNEQHCGVKKKT